MDVEARAREIWEKLEGKPFEFHQGQYLWWLEASGGDWILRCWTLPDSRHTKENAGIVPPIERLDRDFDMAWIKGPESFTWHDWRGWVKDGAEDDEE